ncbi:alpha/beta fold hydrolase [Methanobacterium paludis]|uniref:Alpha/beta hydrolase fold protein n=1 Tax=Methanobacterium paludis (strain DSM 25820 / JCM 18151 / SWAN1) TaxID=868131 RepID=F6D4I5_METPW|nr:alpha/beta hydrolase [Methanobacterium paludis]AEG19225.1 alpha/beta hydrolase fold protein [Methanobacterium paludis]
MNLYVEERGQENSETIIFLHGGGISGWMWTEQLEAFKDYHLLILDLPEHGKSVDVKPFTMKSAAEMVVDIIRTRAHGGRAHLVGISLGGQLILEILSTAPEVVDHVLISGTLVQSIPHTETMLKLLDYAFKAYVPVKDTDFFIKANMRTYNISKSYFKEFKESTRLIKPDSLDRILHENMLFQMPSGLENADVPVLVMAGEKEYKVIKESAEDLIKVLPNAKGITAPKVGHMWNLEYPNLFNKVLRRWITNGALPEEVFLLK